MAFGYPVSLEVSGRKAVVIGEEAVRQGKGDVLLEAGAAVTVIAEGPENAISRLESLPGVSVRRRAYRPGDLSGAFVCVASSGDPAERAAIAAEAHDERVLLNVMDVPQHCDFAAPAVVRRGDLAIAVSTGGRSPALARRLREELERRFGPEWADVIAVLGEVRDETLAELPDLAERARRWQEALDLDEVEELARSGRREEARARLVERLVGVRTP